MGAQQRVSNQEIKAALDRWRGNKAAAARELGISEQALRKRLQTVPPRPAPGTLRGVRLPAEDFERIRQAAFDLAFIERKVWTPDDVAQAFVREAFAAWLEGKVAELRAAKGSR